MANAVEFNLGDFEAFANKMRKAAQGEFRKEFTVFLDGLGRELLRLVEDELKRRGNMPRTRGGGGANKGKGGIDHRNLLASFDKGDADNVWIIRDSGFTLEVGTNVKYAKFVENGHWANPKGVERRWVPGRWDGRRFIYDPSSETGMALKQQWVEGVHFFKGALNIFEKLYPEILERKLQAWLDKYFGMG